MILSFLFFMNLIFMMIFQTLISKKFQIMEVEGGQINFYDPVKLEKEWFNEFVWIIFDVFCVIQFERRVDLKA